MSFTVPKASLVWMNIGLFTSDKRLSVNERCFISDLKELHVDCTEIKIKLSGLS